MTHRDDHDFEEKPQEIEPKGEMSALSDDNYINVFYQRSGAIASYMLRCKMQTIADNCVDSSSLMRCHRSYIVNIKKVSVLHNEADGFVIDFEREGLDSIPVSKTYSAKVLEAFNKK